MIWLLFIPVSAFLGSLGGQRQSWARDLVLPILVGLSFMIKHPIDIWWVNLLTSLCMIGTCNIIRMGYGAYDPINDSKPSFLAGLTRDKDGWVIRTIWGVTVAIISLLPYTVVSFINHEYINLVKVLCFTAVFAFVCFSTVRLRSNIFWTDLIIWSVFGTIVPLL